LIAVNERNDLGAIAWPIVPRAPDLISISVAQRRCDARWAVGIEWKIWGQRDPGADELE